MMLDGDIGFSKSGPIRAAASDQLGLFLEAPQKRDPFAYSAGPLQVSPENCRNRFQDAVYSLSRLTRPMDSRSELARRRDL